MDAMVPYQNDRPILDSFFFAVILAGWCGYIILAPLYLFETGLPQPADVLLLGASALATGLFLIKRNTQFNRIFVSLALMVGLFSMINMVFYTAYGDATFYFSALYYLFNAMAFATTIILFKDNPSRFIRWTRVAIFIAVTLEILWIIAFESKAGYRETGSFNNPNQLDYWALLTSAVIIILNYGRRIPLPDLAAILACAFMVVESLSRGAMLSFILIAVSLLLGRGISVTTKMGLTIIFLLYGLMVILTPPTPTSNTQEISVFDHAIHRLGLNEQAYSPDTYTQRGYDRIIENPLYLITGSGEGAYWRFMDDATISEWSGLEIHSGLATILFSYGIFGFILFGIFIFTIFHKTPWVFYLTLAAIMSYGLTHQHVRFTGFWIYLGLIYGMSRYALSNHKRIAP